MNHRRSFGAPRWPRRIHRTGVGLVELMISLAISAAVLTAVAVAVDASFRAYAINQTQSDLMQRTRLSMYRVLTYVRTCQQHAPTNLAALANFAAGQTVTDTDFAMFTESGKEIEFRFDAVNHRLLMLDNGVSHKLLEGVQTFQVTMQPMRSANSIKTGGAFDLLQRATVLLTVAPNVQQADVDSTLGPQTVTLSCSAMPRRNCW